MSVTVWVVSNIPTETVTLEAGIEVCVRAHGVRSCVCVCVCVFFSSSKTHTRKESERERERQCINVVSTNVKERLGGGAEREIWAMLNGVCHTLCHLRHERERGGKRDLTHPYTD